MTAVLAMSACPNCGAPHSVAPDVHHVVCVYCNTSLAVLRRTSGSGVATLQAETSISSDQIEQVKQLLIDGKRAEAVALYTNAAKVNAAEAERVIDEMFIFAY